MPLILPAENNPIEILIAEDSATQAEQLRYLLDGNGYAVTVAANGRLALEAARRHKPTLLISDVVMPQMDGYALCKAMKADAELKDVPVILVTALNGPQDVVKGLECGADNFIRKPYDERYLLQRIHYLLANRALRRSEKVQMGVEIDLGGKRHFITSERQQILDLLISTYDEAVRLNQDLQRSYQTLNGLYRMAEGLNQCTTEQEVVEKVLERGMELPGVQAGWVFLRDAQMGHRLVATRNLPPALATTDSLAGDCLCSRMLLAGELRQVTNILKCERLQKALGDTRGLRYHASIPLWTGRDVLGVLNLVGPDDGLFSSEDLKILHGVGHQVGQALARAFLHEHLERLVQERTVALEGEILVRKQAEEEIKRQLRRLAALREIDLAITASFDLRVTLKAVLDQVLGQLRVDAAAVLLVDEPRQELVYAAGDGFWTSAIEESRVGLGKGQAGRAALERRTVRVPLLSEADFVRRPLLAREGFVVYHCVPLIVKERLLGVLETYDRLPEKRGADWLEFLETLAGQAALALENASLYQDLEKHAEELEARVEERTTELQIANERLRLAHEEVSRALEQERELNELKTRFVSMVSHEYRTPLSVILSSAQLLEQFSHRFSEEKRLAHLHRIQAMVQSMTGLLDDILVVSRSEAGRLPFTPQPVDLLAFCRELLEDFELGSGNRHQLILDVGGWSNHMRQGAESLGSAPANAPTETNPPFTAWVDEQLMRHILNNLLSNAIKYSPPGSQVRLSLARESGALVIRIADQGIGIPARDQAHLFDAFHRASNVGAVPGTGLGMHIVRRAVTLHGGSIAVQSVEGQGTTVVVQIPARAGAPEMPNPETPG